MRRHAAFHSVGSALAFVLVCAIPGLVRSQDLVLNGQVSAWGNIMDDGYNTLKNTGIRYIPQFNLSRPVGEHDMLNAELLFNTYYSTDFHRNYDDFKFYRAILRYTTTQSETQLGLQKINFGPAQLLRPLMWFDKVDPRDPLKLTDGVWGLRYKYSFIDNSLLWLWGLYGNTVPKGIDAFSTTQNRPEFGARVQTPVPSGEIGATVHTRSTQAFGVRYRENRYAVDGRWDIGIGLWMESVWQQNAAPSPMPAWNRLTTIGGDYTIPEGNGIYILAEHLFTAASTRVMSFDNGRQVSALMMTYPLGVIDNIALQEYFSWQDHALYQYYQWQRTYDSFILTCAAFHYPVSATGIFPGSQGAPVAGYGLQVMLVYNY